MNEWINKWTGLYSTTKEKDVAHCLSLPSAEELVLSPCTCPQSMNLDKLSPFFSYLYILVSDFPLVSCFLILLSLQFYYTMLPIFSGSWQGSQLWHAGSQIYVAACRIFKLQHVGSSSLTRDRTPAPLHWEHGVLATGAPGKLLCSFWLSLYVRHTSDIRIMCEDVEDEPQPCSLTDLASSHLISLNLNFLFLTKEIKHMALHGRFDTKVKFEVTLKTSIWEIKNLKWSIFKKS